MLHISVQNKIVNQTKGTSDKIHNYYEYTYRWLGCYNLCLCFPAKFCAVCLFFFNQCFGKKTRIAVSTEIVLSRQVVFSHCNMLIIMAFASCFLNCYRKWNAENKRRWWCQKELARRRNFSRGRLPWEQEIIERPVLYSHSPVYSFLQSCRHPVDERTWSAVYVVSDFFFFFWVIFFCVRGWD